MDFKIFKELFFVLSPATVYVSKAGLPSFFAELKAFDMELIIILQIFQKIFLDGRVILIMRLINCIKKDFYMTKKKIVINGREISQDNPPFIVAEISANHNGSLERAINTIKCAKLSGVDAVKIQTYTPDTMTLNIENEDFRINEGLWKDRTLYDLYEEAHTPFEWHEDLFNYAKNLGITIFSTPFDESAVDLLEFLNVPAYKIASFEIVDLQLIKYVAKTKKPMLISTGMASLDEISEAIETAKSNGCKEIAILHCISSYPTPISEANLKAIITLREKFKIEVGLSDHTTDNLASVIATSFGSTIIEKHFTLSRSDGGVDSNFSLEPEEMRDLVKNTKLTFQAIKSKDQIRSPIEEHNKIFRRSLYFVDDVSKGQIISKKHVKRIRPGYGLDAKYYDEVIGCKCLKDSKKGDRVTFEHYKEKKI